MKVRYSKNNEIPIQGSRDKLARFHSEINGLLNSDKGEFVTTVRSRALFESHTNIRTIYKISVKISYTETA